MSRVQLALNVDDIDEAVTFYTKLLGTGPAKRKPGYANFAVASRRSSSCCWRTPARAAASTTSASRSLTAPPVHAEIARLTGEGLFTDEEIGTTCCFATQDKVWVTGPGGERWEVYTVLADSDTFGSSPRRSSTPARPPRVASAAAPPRPRTPPTTAQPRPPTPAAERPNSTSATTATRETER
jgi:lactoylglutathione lyase